MTKQIVGDEERSKIEEVLKNEYKDYEYIFDLEGGYVPEAEEIVKRFGIIPVTTPGLNLVFHPTLPRLLYFEVEDKKYDRTCLVSAVSTTWDSTLGEVGLINPSLRLVLPYAKRKITTWGRKRIITHNLETNKKGVFKLYREEWLYDEKYDILDRISAGKLIVGINGKLGIKAESEIELMPLEYEDILDYGDTDLEPVVFGGSDSYLHIISHKKNGAWGANIYIKNFSKPKETEEGWISEPVYTKYEVPNIYEEIKLFAILTSSINNKVYVDKVIFEVTFEGKKGLHSGLDSKLIMPPIFDKIEPVETSTGSRKIWRQCDQRELMNDSWFGYINDEKYMMKNGQMFKLIEANHSEKEITNKVKQLLPSGVQKITES